MSQADLVLIANAGDATITSFELREGRLRLLATNQLPGACSTFAVDEVRNLVYAFAKGEQPVVLTLALDRSSGTLTERHRRPCGAAMAYLALAPGGHLLLGASYHGGFGAVWPVSEGVLAAPTAEVHFPNLHSVAVSDDGRYAYFVSLGANLIAQYALADDGALEPLAPATIDAPDGAGPRHIVLSDDGRHAYVITEFSGEVLEFDRSTSGILTATGSVSAVDPDAGLAHSRFGADPRAEHLIWGADVHTARSGRLLLASERSASTLASFAVDAGGQIGARLALRGTETQPRGFAVSPNGMQAVAVGERSTSASLYAIGEDGTLTQLDRVETGRGANWVRILPAPTNG